MEVGRRRGSDLNQAKNWVTLSVSVRLQRVGGGITGGI